jgi:tetratricopeptide (TPR) repeat protein
MKRVFIFFILLSGILSLWVFSKPQIIGKVLKVKGKAVQISFENKKKQTLKQGDTLTAGTALKTGKNSLILIEMKDGVKQLIPENSETYFLTPKQWEAYRKSRENVEQLYSLVGKKADPSDGEWYTEESVLEKKIRENFNSREFYRVIEVFQDEKEKREQPQILYMAAYSYLALGNPEKSERLFEKVVKSGDFQLRKKAEYGLFLSLYRNGKRENAEKLFQSLRENHIFYRDMKKLLEK